MRCHFAFQAKCRNRLWLLSFFASLLFLQLPRSVVLGVHFAVSLAIFTRPITTGPAPVARIPVVMEAKNEVSNWGHLSSPSCSFRLSRHGVERVQTADLFAKPMERIRVRNCTLFKNGEAAGEDALKKGAFSALLQRCFRSILWQLAFWLQ